MAEAMKNNKDMVCEKTANLMTYTVKCTAVYKGLDCGWGTHELFFDPSNTKVKADLDKRAKEQQTGQWGKIMINGIN